MAALLGFLPVIGDESMGLLGDRGGVLLISNCPPWPTKASSLSCPVLIRSAGGLCEKAEGSGVRGREGPAECVEPETRLGTLSPA